MGVVLTSPGSLDGSISASALAPWSSRVVVVEADDLTQGLASALAGAPTPWVWTVPTTAVGLRSQDLEDLWAGAGLRGVIATDGVRDVPWLGLWPRSRAAEVGIAAREGRGLSVVTAGMVRVQLPLRVFRGEEG